jgi:hypothetical protein
MQTLPISAANAATYNIVDGELVGAFEVDVNGTLYDVLFQNGSCASVFNGCDSADDFTFTSATDAEAAALALLDQVFGADDIVDAFPNRTNGCQNDGGFTCNIFTPYALNSDLDTVVNISIASNWRPLSGLPEDGHSLGGAQLAFDFTAVVDTVYAEWSPTVTVVPIPASGLLFASALAGLMWLKGRKSTG